MTMDTFSVKTFTAHTIIGNENNKQPFIIKMKLNCNFVCNRALQFMKTITFLKCASNETYCQSLDLS